MGRKVKRPVERVRKQGFVYYALHPKTGLVKIGRSADVHSRIREVGRLERAKLRLLAVERSACGFMEEGERHWKFRRVRVHGEWFRQSPALLAHIKRCPRTVRGAARWSPRRLYEHIKNNHLWRHSDAADYEWYWTKLPKMFLPLTSPTE